MFAIRCSAIRFVRILQANGNRVEVQNYIDNTGVQVADVVVGFIYLENKTLEDIKALDTELAAEGNIVRLLLLGPLRQGRQGIREG